MVISKMEVDKKKLINEFSVICITASNDGRKHDMDE